MKRLLTLAALLLCMSATAQTYKSKNYVPLEPVDVPDIYSTTIHVKRNTRLSGDVYYWAAHYLGARSMSVDLSVPANCDIAISEEWPSNIAVRNTAKLSVGGVAYFLEVSYLESDNNKERMLFIDLLEDHVRHISISGLQSITFLDWGEVLYEVTYNPVEQELWRRTAEEVGKAAYIIR